MMFAFVIKNDNIPSRKRTRFIATLVLFALSLFFRNADSITSNYEAFTIRRAVYSALGYCMRSTMIYELISTDFRLRRKFPSKFYVILAIPLIFTTISAFSVFFTDIVYSFTAENNFKSGPLGWTNYIAPVFYLVVLIAIAIRDFLKKNYRHATMIAGCGVLMIVAMLFEYFSFPELMSESAMAMAIMMYLMFFQNNEFLNESKMLKRQAIVDSLTGLYNRAGYNELLRRYADDKTLNVGLMVLDVDKFKTINDTYGHDVGDVMLKEVAKLLKVTFRSSDYVIRYGGDEFVVVMLGITEDMSFIVKNKIESINVQLENPISDIPKTSVSAGVAFSDKGFSDDLFKKADDALYKTKTTTRRNCTVYSEM
jgi:diguanylate cyclase (GGDEF)-like protein